MKGIFTNRSVFFQLGVLLILLLFGYVIASILAIPFMLLCGSTITSMMDLPASILLVIQFISATCIFLLPAIGTAWLCSEQPSSFLQIKTPHIETRLLLLVAATMFLISPTISLTAHFNALLKLPEWMAPIEQWMISAEETTALLMDKLFSQKGILALSVNLIVIAIMAGVTEEFFFRGALFSILRKAIHNHHVVIWVIAIIFSAIHFQFYGFIPRILLGAYLGYLLYWTKNIWVPVFAHFLNNAVAVIGMSNEELKDNAFFKEAVPSEDLGWFSIVAVVCFGLFVICAKAIQKMNGQESASNQEES